MISKVLEGKYRVWYVTSLDTSASTVVSAPDKKTAIKKAKSDLGKEIYRIHQVDELEEESLKENFIEFKNIKLPMKFSSVGHDFEVVSPYKGRFGLRVDGEGMMSSPNLRDVYDYLLKYYKVKMPGAVTEGAKKVLRVKESINLNKINQVRDRLLKDGYYKKDFVDAIINIINHYKDSSKFELAKKLKTLGLDFYTINEDILKILFPDWNAVKDEDLKEDVNVPGGQYYQPGSEEVWEDEDSEFMKDEYDDLPFDNEDSDDYYESDVYPENEFVEDGEDYVWVRRRGDAVHLDFDNWAVWEAHGLWDTDPSTVYFVVDEDTGFIDWGPCDTLEEAQEFLEGKIKDWEET